MVVFTCNYCGESLQKPRVEKHYNFNCRQEKFLTCVDCFKDFRGNEYNAHTKCITEQERYSGKDYVQKVKKGDVKQESWMEMIKSIIKQEQNINKNYKNLLDTVSHFNNVPRKKIKFINFIKSSTGGRTNINDIENIWNIIEKYKEQNISKENNNEDANDKIKIKNTSEENLLKLKCEKRKIKDEKCIDSMHESPQKKGKNSTNENSEIVNICNRNRNFEEAVKFSFSNNIIQVLMEKQTISKRKLSKKILKKYQSLTGKSISNEEIERKINKKLKKIDNLEIENDCIRLLQ